MIKVILPQPLRELAGIEGQIELDVKQTCTLKAVFDSLESQFPALRGTLRNTDTNERRPMIRIFACEEDYSHRQFDSELPTPIIEGREPLIIVGAIAGG